MQSVKGIGKQATANSEYIARSNKMGELVNSGCYESTDSLSQILQSVNPRASSLNQAFPSEGLPALDMAKDFKRYRCSLCNKINGSKNALERHMLTHTGERNYICSYCSKSFTISSNLYRHIRSLHDQNFSPYM